nr:rSAM-modified peptide [Flavobacterium sp. ASV13]
MENKKSKIENFRVEKLSKKQQKTVHGGGDEPTDPTIKTGKGSGL